MYRWNASFTHGDVFGWLHNRALFDSFYVNSNSGAPSQYSQLVPVSG